MNFDDQVPTRPLIGHDLAGVAARLGVPARRLEAALDAVGGRQRARLRGWSRQHRVTDAVASELAVPTEDLLAALSGRC